jgi:hypothetical protein
MEDSFIRKDPSLRDALAGGNLPRGKSCSRVGSQNPNYNITWSLHARIPAGAKYFPLLLPWPKTHPDFTFVDARFPGHFMGVLLRG